MLHSGSAQGADPVHWRTEVDAGNRCCAGIDSGVFRNADQCVALPQALFDRHALGEVARLVDIRSARHRRVIGE